MVIVFRFGGNPWLVYEDENVFETVEDGEALETSVKRSLTERRNAIASSLPKRAKRQAENIADIVATFLWIYQPK